MTLAQMKKELGMESVPECFSEIYDKLKDSFELRASEILSDSYIIKTLRDCYTLQPYVSTVLAAAKEVRKNEAMRMLVCILEQWVRIGGDAMETGYTPPCGEGIEYDFIHLFAAIPTMPDSVQYMRKRGVPQDIIEATMKEYDYCLGVCLTNLGRVAFDFGRLRWASRLIQNRLIRVDRFKYELPKKCIDGVRVYKNKAGELTVFADGLHIHRNGQIVGSVGCEDDVGSFVAEVFETDDAITGHIITDGMVAGEKTEIKKSEWKLCLSKDDPVIPVHILREGDFDEKTIEASYSRMRKIMAECYPDMEYKAFHCISWMMSRDLRKVLKPSSNILAFQSKYIHYPCLSNGTWVFGFVFPGEGGLGNLKNLSENTSLQREVKKLYQEGGYVYDDCGFFF